MTSARRHVPALIALAMIRVLFGGYTTTGSQQKVVRQETLEPVDSVAFGPLLERENVRPSDITGITVGAEEVYLTLEGEPYVLSVKKP